MRGNIISILVLSVVILLIAISGFSPIFEIGGLNPLIPVDLADHLRGYDITCSGYFGTVWYQYVGLIMIASTVLFYAIQYHIIDKPTFNQKHHLWIMIAFCMGFNFFIAFIFPYNSLQSGDYCKDLNFSVFNCAGFAFTNSVLCFVFYSLLTSLTIPRKLSRNCSHTTLLTP